METKAYLDPADSDYESVLNSPTITIKHPDESHVQMDDLVLDGDDTSESVMPNKAPDAHGDNQREDEDDFQRASTSVEPSSSTDVQPKKRHVQMEPASLDHGNEACDEDDVSKSVVINKDTLLADETDDTQGKNDETRHSRGSSTFIDPSMSSGAHEHNKGVELERKRRASDGGSSSLSHLAASAASKGSKSHKRSNSATLPSGSATRSTSVAGSEQKSHRRYNSATLPCGSGMRYKYSQVSKSPEPSRSAKSHHSRDVSMTLTYVTTAFDDHEDSLIQRVRFDLEDRPSHDMFDAAREEVYRLMAKDPYRRFLRAKRKQSRSMKNGKLIAAKKMKAMDVVDKV